MKAEMYALHHEHEQTHWWFAARREIVLHLLRKEIAQEPQLQKPLRLLDIGCGAGGMLGYLAQFGEVMGVDPEPNAVAWAREKGSANVKLGSLPDNLPFGPDDRFDIITLLDVIEHVEEDTQSLQRVHSLLQPNGRIIITVPAFQFLWTGHDLINEHKRRYTRSQLLDTMRKAGLRVDFLSYYNTILFPPVAAVRLLKRGVGRADQVAADLGAVPRPLNRALTAIFAAERYLLGSVPLPFGVSLIAIARAS